MSRADEPTEQVGLGESLETKARRARERATAHGARYAGSAPRSQRDDTDVPRDHCRCGRPIKADVARVVGDDRGVVPACDECARNASGESFTRTTVAARNWRSQRATVIAERPVETEDGVERVEVQS
jgi:ribosomal protein L37AE/L43A